MTWTEQRDEVFKEVYRRIENNPSEFGIASYDAPTCILHDNSLTLCEVEKQKDGQLLNKKINYVPVRFTNEMRWLPVSKFKLTDEQLRIVGWNL